MSPKMSIAEMLEELEEAATIEGSEVGEQWQALVSAKAAADYGSEAFLAAYEAEVREQHEHFRNNFRIVERQESRIVTYTDIEFVG